MKLKKLSEKQFKEFADTNPEITFYQTVSWAHLKRKMDGKHIIWD